MKKEYFENTKDSNLNDDFDNAFKNALNAAFDSEGPVVGRELIAATMDRINAIREEDADDRYFGTDDDVDTLGSGIYEKRAVIKRIIRIGAPVAAALIIGIFGISLIRNGLFGSIKSNSSAEMAMNNAYTEDEYDTAAAVDVSEEKSDEGGFSDSNGSPKEDAAGSYSADCADEAALDYYSVSRKEAADENERAEIIRQTALQYAAASLTYAEYVSAGNTDDEEKLLTVELESEPQSEYLIIRSESFYFIEDASKEPDADTLIYTNSDPYSLIDDISALYCTQ